MLSTLILATSIIQASDEYRRAHRTDTQRDEYLESKRQKEGHRDETAEFRFALKLAEYKEMLENGTMSQEEYDKTIARKSEVYLDKFKNEKARNTLIAKNIEEASAFLNEYINLPLRELQARVGTKEELGSMQRYVDQNC